MQGSVSGGAMSGGIELPHQRGPRVWSEGLDQVWGTGGEEPTAIRGVQRSREGPVPLGEHVTGRVEQDALPGVLGDQEVAAVRRDGHGLGYGSESLDDVKRAVQPDELPRLRIGGP